MNEVDIGIVLIVAISSLISLWRGFVKELMSLITLLAAIAFATFFAPHAAVYLEGNVEPATIRLVVGYGLCFLLVIVIGTMVTWMLRRLLRANGITNLDRVLGLMFGFTRGVLVVSLFVFVGHILSFDQSSQWDGSKLIGYFRGLTNLMVYYMPDDMLTMVGKISNGK